MWIETRDSSDTQNFIEPYSYISTPYNQFSFHGNVAMSSISMSTEWLGWFLLWISEAKNSERSLNL